MKELGLEVKINNDEPINLELEGVVSIILLYNNGETNITVSGLRSEKEENSERVLWLDQQLKEHDNVNIRFSKNPTTLTPPARTIEVDKQKENERKLLRYYALKKELEGKNLL